MTNSSPNSSPETDLGYGKLFAVLIRQRLWIAGVLTGVIAITTPLALRQNPIYESSMQLLVESNYQAPEKRTPDLASTLVDSAVEIDYATQLKLMTSSELLQRAVDEVKGEYSDMTIEDLQKAIRLSQIEDDEVKTKIFEITFVDENPAKTQMVLEAIQSVYLEYNLEKQQERLSRGLTFIDDQLPIARQELDKAQQALTSFRQTYNLVNPEELADGISRRLIDIQKSRQDVDADLAATQSRIQAIESALSTTNMVGALASARLSQSARYQSLLDELQTIDKELVEKRLIYTDNSLQVMVVAERRAETLNLLSAEASLVIGTLEGSNIGSAGGLTLGDGQFGKLDLDLTADWVQQQTKQSALESTSQSLATSERELRTQLDKLPELINEYNSIQPEVETNQITIEKLLTARQALAVELAQGGFNWQVVEPPQWGEKIGPNHKRSLILNIILGGALGIAAAFVRDALNDAVHTPEDIEAKLNVPLVGVFPQPPSTFDKTIEQHHAFTDAIALIYKKLTLRTLTSPWRSLLLTSAQAQDGKSTLAIALAISAHRAGDQVLLIDANLRNPHLHSALQLPNEKGLTTVLKEALTEQWSLPILKSRFGFNVLTAGPPAEGSLPILGAKSLGQLMAELSTFYDRVIVDTTTLSDSADVLSLASVCDAICLVGRVNQTTETALEVLHADIQNLPVLGVVVGDGKSAESSKTVKPRSSTVEKKRSRKQRNRRSTTLS
ncbi:MAG: GumC family protein [Phormidesmis sp.]